MCYDRVHAIWHESFINSCFRHFDWIFVMNPHELIRLLQHILPWIPSVNEGIRAEILQIIERLKGR
jgi:hypothetical protein